MTQAQRSAVASLIVKARPRTSTPAKQSVDVREAKNREKVMEAVKTVFHKHYETMKILADR